MPTNIIDTCTGCKENMLQVLWVASIISGVFLLFLSLLYWRFVVVKKVLNIKSTLIKYLLLLFASFLLTYIFSSKKQWNITAKYT